MKASKRHPTPAHALQAECRARLADALHNAGVILPAFEIDLIAAETTRPIWQGPIQDFIAAASIYAPQDSETE